MGRRPRWEEFRAHIGALTPSIRDRRGEFSRFDLGVSLSKYNLQWLIPIKTATKVRDTTSI